MTEPVPMTDPIACIVIPCFNEASRLDRAAVLGLAAAGSLRLLLVDDGSTDATASVLAELATQSARIEVLSLGQNQGKAEAVRQGLVAALAGATDLVGYYDADLATPPEELLRLVDVAAATPDVVCVLGARVALLGSAIHRRAVRHYAGRLFSSAASVALGIAVYDTQCGAKVFRRCDALSSATERPFRSRWAFDVELLDRLLTGSDGVVPIRTSELLEVPLHAWRDVPGSQMRLSGAAMAVLGVGRIGLARRRRLRRARERLP